MGCNACLNKLEEQEVISLHNDEEKLSNKKNKNFRNTLHKEIITLSPKKNNDKENIKKELSSSKKLIEERNELFNTEILYEINNYRIKHGVEELIYDKTISNIAQKYAEKCARENELELSENKYNNKDLGEIIFCCKDDLNPKNIVDIWYNEGSANYDFNKEPEIPNDFTQIIWKNSKLFGIGHALTKENKLYIVANFFPEGNIKGEFLENVFPIINQSEPNSFISMNTKFLDEILNSHNELRLKHNSPPLKLNPNLLTLAQKMAEKMAKKKQIKSIGNNQKLGKNYFFSKNNCTGEEVTSFWYKGKYKYDFKKNNTYKDELINNFTQLIWKNTKEVGFGFANDNKGNFYVVGYYFPPGNIKGEYKSNVLPDY